MSGLEPLKGCGVGERSSSRKVGAWDGDGEGGSSKQLLRVRENRWTSAGAG